MRLGRLRKQPRELPGPCHGSVFLLHIHYLARQVHIPAFTTCSVPWEGRLLGAASMDSCSFQLPYRFSQWVHWQEIKQWNKGKSAIHSHNSSLIRESLAGGPLFQSPAFVLGPPWVLVNPPCHCLSRPSVVRSSQGCWSQGSALSFVALPNSVNGP